jgi:hypothetical protein
MNLFKIQVSLMLALSVFTTTVVPSNVHAITHQNYEMKVITDDQIAKVFNKFRYDMTVEWDQQDPYFKEYAQKEFENSLMDLRAKGASDEQIQTYMEKNMLDEKTQQEYTKLLNTLKKQNISEDEASRLAMKFMENNYQQGTSFTGGGSHSYRKVMVVVGVVIVGVVTWLIIKNCKSGSTSSSSSSSTSSSSSSTTGGDNGNNGNNGGTNANNGFGNGDQDAPGGSCTHNNAENAGCVN